MFDVWPWPIHRNIPSRNRIRCGLRATKYAPETTEVGKVADHQLGIIRTRVYCLVKKERKTVIRSKDLSAREKVPSSLRRCGPQNSRVKNMMNSFWFPPFLYLE